MTSVDTTDPALTEDAFLGGALRLLQPAKGYRAGLDAVLLAAAVPAIAGKAERILDIGAGVGTVGLSVARRIVDAQVTLVERDAVLADLAGRNIVLNGFDARCRIVALDIAARAGDPAGFGLAPHSFAHVLANPPYHDAELGTPAADARKAVAHAMAAGDLERWVRFMVRMTAAGGTATLIHKAEALAALLAAVEHRFGAIKLLPIHPRPGLPGIRVIVQGVRGSRAPLTLLPPFVLHGAEGHGFTPAAEAILKHGAGLRL